MTDPSRAESPLARIVVFAVRNRLLVLLSYLALMGAGAVALVTLPVDAFPDTTPVMVQVNAGAPAFGPEEIEQQITLPIELAMSGLPGLTDVRSISKFGLSQVSVMFRDGIAIEDARQYVAERLATVDLPDGIDPPQLGPISTGLGEIFHYVVQSPQRGRTLEELRTLHDWVIKPELLKTPGVAEVNAWGGYKKQYHVVVSPVALLKFGLTLTDVYEALETNNENVGGGVISFAGQSQFVQGVGRVQDLNAIRDIVITSQDGQPVRISDVADDVKIDHEIRRGAVTANGDGEVVLGLAFMLMGENARIVTAGLRERLNSVRSSLPDDVEVEIVYDRADLTSQVIRTVQHNLLFGALLVVAALFLILGDLRAGLIVAAVIPLAMMFAALGMREFGIAASLLSLGAIDFGILVDGSVVMTESNLRELRNGAGEAGRKLTVEERIRIVLRSGQSVARPIAFGMGIIVLVFVPVLTLEGVEGRMFRPMAWTFIFALIGALVIALTLSPVLGFYMLPSKPRRIRRRPMDAVVNWYGAALSRIVRWRMLVLGVAAVLLAGGGVAASRLGGEFVPRMNEGSLVLNIVRLAGVSLDESMRYNTQIEQLLLEEFPDEIDQVWSRIGAAEIATDPMGLELTDVFVMLKPRSQWTRARSQAELSAAIQEEVADLPGLNLVMSQPIEMRMNEMIAGIRSDIGIKIIGDDFDELIRLSDDVQRVLLEIPGASDISADQLTGQPTMRIAVDRNAIARAGVPARDVLAFVEAVGGREIGQVYEGQRRFSLVARFPDRHRTDPHALAASIIPTESGQYLPLHSVATIETIEGPATINREWSRRLMRVQCNVVDRDVASFVQEARRRIAQDVELPVGYVIDWGGQFENLQRARLRLSIVVPATLLLVFFLLLLSLRRVRDVVMIYLAIPFAALGGIAALWLRDIPFSVSAAVGFIALGGIAVLNGQILIEAIRENAARGLTGAPSCVEAAKRRFRPVLATAITDAVGFLPMAISTGIGAEVQRPLATVVIGGVVTSTALTLIVLPTMYAWFGGAPTQPTDDPAPATASERDAE